MQHSWLSIILCCLCLVGCFADTQDPPAAPDSDATAAGIVQTAGAIDPPVPVVDYPDVYISRYSFGFNLPDGWSAELNDEANTLTLWKGVCSLLVGYREEPQQIPPFREPIPYDEIEDAGTLTLNSFWHGEIVINKYRLVRDGRVLVVYYGDEVSIGSLRLTMFLREEPPSTGAPQGISAAVEAEADAIVQSYEEHGWEE